MRAVKKRFNRGDYTLRELAELTGKSTRSIARYTSMPREEYLEQAKRKNQQVIKLYSEGKKPKEIAKELDYALSTVYYVLKKREA